MNLTSDCMSILTVVVALASGDTAGILDTMIKMRQVAVETVTMQDDTMKHCNCRYRTKTKSMGLLQPNLQSDILYMY